MTVAVEFDPLLRLQLEELHRFLDKVNETKYSQPDKLVGLAEHICEWTRTILSRSFGRIEFAEASALREVFLKASSIIASFADVDGLHEDGRKTVAVYSQHIGGRVRHLPLDSETTVASPNA